MPYIGNSHNNVGEHVNNFKVLDDISSYTATFDGSAAGVVSTTNETIRVADHRFLQGQRVTYNNGGGSNIGGLTSGTAYYISLDSANTVKLATSLVNANNNTVINLSSVGSGSSHTLTAAFDGVNKEFKLTYGTKAAIVLTAPQLNIAINNVIQRPNLNPLSFTEGFAVKDGNKIIFQSAPQVNDVFWGSITSNSVSVFDVEDNAVDNFTGDGSTTNFTLSAIPPNKESILVTLDGVVQHPSDNSTTRAYTIDASVVVFSSAPASGVLIQVRHIGFASPTTPVRSFYGRTGNVTLNNTDDIITRNINAVGIITATSIKFSNNVGISSNSPVEKLDVNGSINAGEENSAFAQIRNEVGTNIQAFKHYFSVNKNNLSGNSATYNIISVTMDQNFHQAFFEVSYGCRLQAVGDTNTRPSKILFGVNRFGGGNSVSVNKKVIEQDSTTASHCDVNIVSVTGTNYVIRVEFSSTPNVSSFAGGWIEGSCLAARFADVDYYYGVRR